MTKINKLKKGIGGEKNKMKNKNIKNQSEEYKVGSIAQLIASANSRTSIKKIKKTSKVVNKKKKCKEKDLYDSKLCNIFKKNEETVKPSTNSKSTLSNLPLIPTFSKYVPIIPGIKLSNKDAANIRIEAKLKRLGLNRQEQNQFNQEDTLISSTKSKVLLKKKIKKTKIKKEKKLIDGSPKSLINKKKRKKDHQPDVSEYNLAIISSDTITGSNGIKHECSIGSGSESTEMKLDDSVQDIPKRKKKLKQEVEKKMINENNLSSSEDEEDSMDNKDKTTLSKLKLYSEMNKPKEKNKILESRTIFIGNVPKECKKKEMKKLFRIYGEIEAIRFRCATPAKPRALKKIAFRKNELHPDRNSLVAYIRFKTREEAEKAAGELNGIEFKEHHLNVDMADKSSTSVTTAKDNKKAIFIGNLHLRTEDDELWDAFKDCGIIQSVRIIRDQATGLGKGFGYVNFQTSDSVELALKKNEVEVRNRSLRIARCVKKIKTIGKNFVDENEKINSFSNTSNHINNNKKQNNSIKTNNIKPYHSNNTNDKTSFGGDRLAEIGKLKRKSKRVNIGEKKKASIARQLAGKSKPRSILGKRKKSQGERQRPLKNQRQKDKFKPKSNRYFSK